jgi:two-component system CheB/CheR fusion protein
VKPTTDLAIQLRSAFDHSRDEVRRARDRAHQAAERARRMRLDLRQRREALVHLEGARAALSVVEAESAQAISESERFVAVVSHELRQPLNAAVGALSLLEADASQAARDRARVVLRRQLLHMSGLLDDLLDMSRLTLKTLRVQRIAIDLRTVLEDACENVRHSAERAVLTLRMELPGSTVPVLGDPSRLQQAVTNLLSNAIRYTPPGGTVNVSLTSEGTTAAITVEDTGQGIAPIDLPSIFEPFWRGRQTNSDGFGVGLALVRGIVELHDGSVVASSDGPGTGAQFRVTLPIFASD